MSTNTPDTPKRRGPKPLPAGERVADWPTVRLEPGLYAEVKLFAARHNKALMRAVNDLLRKAIR